MSKIIIKIYEKDKRRPMFTLICEDEKEFDELWTSINGTGEYIKFKQIIFQRKDFDKAVMIK